MALLFLLRIGIVFTFGFFGIIVSVSGFINERGPDPRIKFTLEPPAVALVSKNNPLLLPCSANITDIPFLQKHDELIDDFDDDDEEDEDEEEEEEENDDIDERMDKDVLLNKKDITHFTDLKSSDDIMTNEEYEEDDDDDDEEYEQKTSLIRQKRNINKKEKKDISLKYIWYRNDINILNTPGFRIFPNGTLKIQYTINSSGVYRCLVNDTLTGAGSIISKETIVSSSNFERVRLLQNISAIIGYPLVLNCPFSSVPAANFSWYINKAPIFFDNINFDQNKRYFQLLNGSLLIKKVQEIDNGKYRCIAINNFITKSKRNYTPMVNVVPINNNSPKHGLLPPLQSFSQLIKPGETLKLLCASYSNKVQWIFTPRHSSISIGLNNNTFEIQIKNSSIDKHDGFYTCISGDDSQIYDVKIMVPPTFIYTFLSINTSIAAKTKFNCSATGNPMPYITWYHNGIQILNNYRINYDNHSLTIHTLEPEDEGLYQCFAKNNYSEIYTSGYLTVRKQKRLHRGAENVQCYPVNHKTLLIKFKSRDTFSMINYFLATDNPYTWISASPIENISNSSITINHNLLPLRLYVLYLRGYITQNVVSVEGNRRNEYFSLTRLSTPIKCATQGLVVYSNIFQNRIFIWWPHVGRTKPEFLVLQFWHNDSSNPTVFSDHIIGTHFVLDENQPWQEIETNLVKIPAKTNIIYPNIGIDNIYRRKRSFVSNSTSRQIFESLEGEKITTKNLNDDSKTLKEMRQSNVTITEVKIPGNVTGILIPNTNKIVVRVLASIFVNDHLFEQDLSYVEWNTFDWSMNNNRLILKLSLVSSEARSITISWNSIEEKRCMKICYKNLSVDLLIRSEKLIDCINIKTETSMQELTNLKPFTNYKIYIKSCDSKDLLSSSIEVQTKIDVPGPVTKYGYSKTNGITLTWSPPADCNGHLLNYYVEWNKNGKKKSANVTISNNSFTLPNVTSNDKVNITIRAVGTAGVGIPIYIDLTNEFEEALNEMNNGNPALGIIIGVLGSISFVVACYSIYKCNRSCKKRDQNNVNRTLPQCNSTPNQAPYTSCHSDFHEMETLIAKTEPIIMANGRGGEKHCTKQSTLNVDNDKRVDELTVDITNNKDSYLEQIQIPPAPPDNDNDYETTNPKGSNGINNKNNINNTVPQLHHINGNSTTNKNLSDTINLPPQMQHSISTSPPLTANGNLRITENPQYTKNSNINTTSILDNSQQKLLNTTIDSVNIDDEICVDMELNVSNLSSKPLQSSINYRRPIVGPNG